MELGIANLYKELLPDGCDSHTHTVQPQRLTPDELHYIRQRWGLLRSDVQGRAVRRTGLPREPFKTLAQVAGIADIRA
ncbi:MAG: hypothetical protein ACK4NB_02355 [Fimbriimonadales bacterium]